MPVLQYVKPKSAKMRTVTDRPPWEPLCIECARSRREGRTCPVEAHSDDRTWMQKREGGPFTVRGVRRASNGCVEKAVGGDASPSSFRLSGRALGSSCRSRNLSLSALCTNP